MKTLTFFFAMLFASTNAAHADAWIQKADLTGGPRQGAVGFSIGNKGYLGTGEDNGYVSKKDFWEYDPDNNTWTQKADFGGDARAYATGFSIGNKGYIGTGSTSNGGGNLLRDFWEYDPTTNSWTQKADFGGVGRLNATGFSIGSKGYLGTGNDGSPYYELKDFWEYDPATNIWTQRADVGGAGRAGAVGFSIGNKGYIGTGKIVDYPYAVKDFWEYDPANNSWTPKAAFGGSGRQYAVGLSINGQDI